MVVVFGKPRERTSRPRRLNASAPDVATKSPYENRLLIAFSIEKNSGIDDGDLAEPTMFVVLADPRWLFASVNSEGLNWADAVEGHPHPLAPQGGGNIFHSGGRQFASKRDPDWQAYAAWINGARLAAPKE